MSVLGSLIRGAIPEWQERANCAGTHTDAFYPEKGESPWGAKRICRGCEVRPQCLEWALDNGEKGVWGGTTEPERRRIVRRSAEGNTATLPMGCTECGDLRSQHKSAGHAYQVPDMPTVLARAAALKTRKDAA